MQSEDLRGQSHPTMPFEDIVSGLVAEFKQRWWSCDTTLPDLGPVYNLDEKKIRESRLADAIKRLSELMKQAAEEPHDRQTLQDRFLPLAGDFLKTTFDLEERHLTALTSYGFTEAIEEFVLQARRFDPDLSAADIYQAGRNAWTMTFFQYLFGLTVKMTPAIWAYSLMYPYSDNYLDDPAIPAHKKTEFSHRFKMRLEGKPIPHTNSVEQKIFGLVGIIEGQFDRKVYPEVHASLKAIYRAQVNSMRLQAKEASPYEMDVLGVVFEKGGTSVLADAYLVAGNLTPFQRLFSFYYGAFTQFMDDLEDVEQDRQDGIMTIFSQTAHRWPLDGVTNRLILFGQGLLDDLSHFSAPRLETLEEIMRKCITPLLIDSAGRVGHLYSRSYLEELERHSPYRLSKLKKVRRQVEHRFSAEQIVEIIVRAGKSTIN